MKPATMMLAATLLLAPLLGMTADGLVALKSDQSVEATMDRFETQAKERGLTVFARIDHAAGAERIGASLRPTELIIFGNPQGGTSFMQCAQSVGIDLPLKVLVWEDQDGQVWLAYNDPAYLAERHQVPACPAVAKLQGMLSRLAEAAVASQ